jgi:methylglutaconyl-CoA hydratase
MSLEFISYVCNDRIGTIQINRADKRNALNPQLIHELKSCFEMAASDPECKVIVLKADGPVFSAGADLAYLSKISKNSEGENLEDSMKLMELYKIIYNFKKVVIAQVQGDAIAGGCGLVTVCDFVFSVPEARFGYTEVKIGFVPALVSSFLLRKVGETRAKELLLTGNLISAEEAKLMGLINYVELENEINDKVVTFALNLSLSASSESLKLTKKTINKVQELTLDEALIWSAKENARSRNSDDYKRGITSFLNKQKISW